MGFPKEVRIDPLGESAAILRELGEADPVSVAEALRARPEVLEATPSYETVGVYLRDGLDLAWLGEALGELELVARPEPRLHEIPVCYGLGEDLEEAAVLLGLSKEELVQLHCGDAYRCYAVGFQPGFAYLGYLCEPLAGLGRRTSPRVRVPAGSVGIAGRQTGIYPCECPGGWWLIGQTPLTIVDVYDAFFPIAAGDRIRFFPISADEFERRKGRRL
jgi:KipI family sensor histidine kinase inhibitor